MFMKMFVLKVFSTKYTEYALLDPKKIDMTLLVVIIAIYGLSVSRIPKYSSIGISYGNFSETVGYKANKLLTNASHY